MQLKIVLPFKMTLSYTFYRFRCHYPLITYLIIHIYEKSLLIYPFSSYMYIIMYLTKLIGFGITSYSHLFFREETVDISHKRSFDVLEYGGNVLRLQKIYIIYYMQGFENNCIKCQIVFLATYATICIVDWNELLLKSRQLVGKWLKQIG